MLLQGHSLGMQLLCTCKIGIHSSTPSHAYPVIRLPREFAPLAGETARIYETERDGKLAFVMTVDKKVAKFCANSECNDLDQRLSAIESQIVEIKSLLLTHEIQKAPQSPLFHQSTLKTNGLGRIRTGDLRRVKTEVSEVFAAFPSGAITTRKASAPS